MFNQILVGILVAVGGGLILFYFKNKIASKSKREIFRAPDLTSYEEPNRVLEFKYPANLGKISPWQELGDEKSSSLYGFRILKGWRCFFGKNWSFGFLLDLYMQFWGTSVSYMHIILFKDSEKDHPWDTFLNYRSKTLESPILDTNQFYRIFFDVHIITSKMGDGREHSYYLETETRGLHKKIFTFAGWKESDGVYMEVIAYIGGPKKWNYFRNSIRASFESVSFNSSKVKKKLDQV